MADEAEFEEGEICSEDESLQEKDCLKAYNVVERPDMSQFLPKAEGHRKTAEITYSSEEEYESSSSEDEDSPVKKFKPVIRQEQGKTNTAAYKQDAKWVQVQHENILKQQQKNKKCNNIWGSVLEEENMSRSVNSLNRNEAIDYLERGAESYDYTKASLEPRHERPVSESEEDDSESEDEESDDPADLTSKEIFGFVLDKKKPRKHVKERLGYRTNAEQHVKHDSERKLYSEKSKECNSEKSKSGSWAAGKDSSHTKITSDEISRKRKRKKKKRKNLDTIFDVELKPMKTNVTVHSQMEEMELADTILDALREPQEKLELIAKIIEEIGSEKTIKLFNATKDVESMGGLMIQNGLRRRTPGGVFLYLVRNDADLSPDQHDRLFTKPFQEFQAERKKARKQSEEKPRSQAESQNTGMDFSEDNIADANTSKPSSFRIQSNAEDELGSHDAVNIELS